MSEWWTYRLSDFLMFSPSAYWRLVERYNRDAWPLHLLMLGAGLALLWLAGSGRPGARRVVAVVLTAVWLWVGWGFHARAYSQINWAAEYFAAAFATQALLMLVLGMLHSSGRAAAARPGVKASGMALAAGAMLLYPLEGLLAGRPWNQAEVFGLMPDPTSLATLGLLLATGQPHRAWLAVIPLLSTMAGWTTRWLLST